MSYSEQRHALIRDTQPDPAHYDPTDPKLDPPHDHYHVVITVYDGATQIGKSIAHWQVHRDDDTPQGQAITHSQVYTEPDGKHVMLAVQAEARRQVLD